jgi:hypothetical protein
MSCANPEARHALLFFTCLAVIMAAFLFLMGLGPARLPFPPEAAFSDAVTSHWANALFLRRSVLDDHAWPLWRPTIMSGQPFAANPLNKVWYPPQWLVFLLPPTPHLNVLIWFHLTLAGAGAWAWGRVSGLRPWAAALVGLGYAFAPRLIASVGAGHLDLVYAAAWFPWLLWAIHRLVDPAASRWAGLWVALIAALCFLADVRLSAYIFATAAIYLLWRWWRVPELRSRAGMRRLGSRVAVAALLAAGLTAIQWVPLLMLRSDLSRNTITLKEAAANSLSAGQWIGLLIGDHGGSWETLVYVGVSTLVLAVTALLMRPREFAVWGVLLLLIVLYAMGDRSVLWTALNRLVPPLRWWRVPPRVWLIAALIFPYLAGWGAQLLAERPPDRKTARLGIVAVLSGGTACGLFSTLALSSQIKLTAALGTFALPAVAAVMLLAIFGKLRSRAVLICLALVVVTDLVWIDRTLVEGRGEDEWLKPYQALAEYLRRAEATRVYSPSYSLPQQAAVYWNVPQFDGVDPFQFEAYVRAAAEATGVRASGYSVTIPAYKPAETVTGGQQSESEVLATANRDAVINPRLLGQWLVSYVVSAFEIRAEGLVLETRIGDVYVYRNTFAPQVSLSWHGPNRITVHASEPYTGTLYAVAGGRWKTGPHDDGSPGLPGTVDGSSQTWSYAYDSSEVWIGLLVSGALIGLAAMGRWTVLRG